LTSDGIKASLEDKGEKMRSRVLLVPTLAALAASCPVGSCGVRPWQLRGSAAPDGNRMVLTGPGGCEGSAWSNATIDAGQEFRLRFTCYLGDSAGAGRGSMILMFAEEPSALDGEEGPFPVGRPLVGVEIRTNQENPMEDSVELHVQGGDPMTCAGGQVLAAGNLDNGLEHTLSVSWDPDRGRFHVWLDGMEEPVLAAFERDFFSSRFTDPEALRWGFAGYASIPGRLQWFRPDTSWATDE
jgi:hypothetical protein